MTDRLPDALRLQATACGELGSPFMHRLLNLIADRIQPDMPFTRHLFNWPGDIGPFADSIPLRLAGGLNALRMLGRAGLQEVYPPNDTDDDTLWGAVKWAFSSEAPFLTTYCANAPQTNEVRRSAPLIAVGHWLSQRFKMPLDLIEIGSSGGLNLMWDRYRLDARDMSFGPEDSPVVLAPEWRGTLPPVATPTIHSRKGIDLSPIDLRDPIDRLRLRSYLWADQTHRIELTDAAITLFDADVVKRDALEWLEQDLSLSEGRLTLVYTTIAWQYLSEQARERGRAVFETIGKSATPRSPLAWFQMEADGQQPGAGLLLRLWPGHLRIKMGRADFHGRWVDWHPPL